MSKSTRIILLSITVTLSALLVACATIGLAAQPTLDPRAAAGKQLFEVYCSSCHSTLPDTVIVGPSLSEIAGRAGDRVAGLDARAYLRESILYPKDYVVEGYKDLMPGNFSQILEDEQVEALIAYLLILK